ncbi:MlaA family lipoprotein [Allochromatium vinosum]|uniref:VacJ family lipoprotein n=1 Tax=Allochromatium vinosum (strain ATCC 17899 / DSM 180 / NBRC 103801 / NCIMB 10441 / D) TaxID=572477 RepID=D3RUI1_ALLVD|nr:VacJ family lipoprotein [Allochromatium vinosum DSM 180]MBK1654796.1 ABC transporter [Allochromatium vinosum]
MVMGRSWTRALAWLVAPTLLLGCASKPDRELDPRDPLEPLNRATFRFNMNFDKALVQPIARGYQKVTPEPVDRGITNFFDNLADVTSAVNNVLQFKMSRAGSDVGRVFINSTVGVLGFVDVATNVGLPSYKEDFGQTLGYWGLESGAYLVTPFLGPSSMRDAIGMGGDIVMDPLVNLKKHQVHWGLVGVRVIDRRADLLTATEIVEEASIDPYSFVRDAYLQRRQSLVYDGNPPTDTSQPDFWDEVEF